MEHPSARARERGALHAIPAVRGVRRPPSPHALERGVTLLELLLLLTLVGILAAVSAPSIVRSFSAQSIDHEARKIHSWLAYARANAIAQQRDYRFALEDDGSYEIQSASGGAWVRDAGSAIGETISITIGNESAGAIVFHPHGRVDSAATIVIDDGAHERTIHVLASGLVRWESASL